MQILTDKDTVVTASKDKNMKFWYPPTSWEKTDENGGTKTKLKAKLKTTANATTSSYAKPSKAQVVAKKKPNLGSDSEDDDSDDEIVLRKPANKQAAKVN